MVRMISSVLFFFFCFQAKDGIRDAQESRGLGDVYKRQILYSIIIIENENKIIIYLLGLAINVLLFFAGYMTCLLYTSDAADDLFCVDLGGRRIIKKTITPQFQNVHTLLYTHTPS